MKKCLHRIRAENCEMQFCGIILVFVMKLTNLQGLLKSFGLTNNGMQIQLIYNISCEDLTPYFASYYNDVVGAYSSRYLSHP